MNEYLNLLHDKQRRALDAARAIVDDAHRERRSDLTAEEDAAYQRATAEARDAKDKIDEWHRDREASDAADRARLSIEPILAANHRSAIRGPEGLRGDMIDRFLRGDPQLGRDLEVSFAEYRASSPYGKVQIEHRDLLGYSGGGTFVVQNPEVSSRFYEVLLDVGQIWALGPEIVHTQRGNPVSWPKMTAAGTATITAEAAALVEADPTLGTITTTPVAYKKLTQLSNEIVQDSRVDLISFIGRDMGNAMAKQYGTHFATGNGSSKPEGYMGGSVTVSAAGTCSPENAIKLQMSINQHYRARGKFATNSGVLSYWRRLRADAGGTTGPWLLQPPSSPGAPEVLFGAAVVEDNNIVAHGSAVKSVAYGDFQSGYLVHDAGFRFERSDDYAFANDLVSWRGVWRLDGRIRDTNAIAIYQATAD